MTRKLATIRTIDALSPIKGADAIECATVGGWKVVVKKGLYAIGDLAVYCEIDSWIPTELAPFLSKGKEPNEFEGTRGERLRTIKLRGQLSQGLLLPVKEVFGLCYPDEGEDVTEFLHIKKWEKQINAQLVGVYKGNFPSQIPKTDKERVQNLVREIVSAYEAGVKFEITEKMDGSSMTCYLIDGEFGVCSRNMDLIETESNAFWKTARANNVEEAMRSRFGMTDYALQGELIGPDIQGNIYKLTDMQFQVFDIYNIHVGEYVDSVTRRTMVNEMNLTHVPFISYTSYTRCTGNTADLTDIHQILKFAEGKSALADTEREGIVFKEVNGGFTFKAISNKYLLGI